MLLVGLLEGRVDAIARKRRGGDVQFPAPPRVPQALAGKDHVGRHHLVHLVEHEEVGRDALHPGAAVRAAEVDAALADLFQARGVGVAHEVAQVVRVSYDRREPVAGELPYVVVRGEEVDRAAPVGHAEVERPADGILRCPHLGRFADDHGRTLVRVDLPQVVVVPEGERSGVYPPGGGDPLKELV